MFKQLVTLLRGHAHEAGATVIKRNAFVLLDQQIRDVARAIYTLRRTQAAAMAEDRQQQARLTAISERLTGLEDRTRAALAGGRQDLALVAAETIAELEMEREAVHQARCILAPKIEQLRQTISDSQRRFTELQRGRRLAGITEGVARAGLPGVDQNILREARNNTRQLARPADQA